jgi:hypothetical protein
MSERHSTTPAQLAKPPKPGEPNPEFPLYAHAAGVWAKRFRGKLYYFGPWNDPDGALKKYLEQKCALHAGRKPREASDGTAIARPIRAPISPHDVQHGRLPLIHSPVDTVLCWLVLCERRPRQADSINRTVYQAGIGARHSGPSWWASLT